MALVTGQTWTAEIPHELGQSMTFRKLSWRELEAAAAVKHSAILADLKDLGDLITKLPKGQATLDSEVDYDTFELLKKGIVGWTYVAEVTEQNISLLDKQTADWAIGQIKQAHAPRAQAERKNG